MKTFIIGVSLALALLTGPAWGGIAYFSASDTIAGCRSLLQEASQSPEAWFCYGVVQGEVDTAFDRCIPSEVIAYDQVVRVVVGYADRHPEQMYLPFTLLAAAALKEAWPCKP